MNRVAALSAKDRNELFTVTAEKRGMGTIAIVEKDFWVCWTLKHLFEHPELSKQLIFKGGTSLSKVYGLIDRFSEDIDLVLDWRIAGGEQDPMGERSNTKQRKLNETLNAQACVYIAETMLPLLSEALGSHCSLEVNSNEKDQGHIIRVEYPKTSNAEGLLPYIQLEIGPLASWLPHSEHTITPYPAEDFPDQFDEPHCAVRVIDAERTFWEKATILHHEVHRPETSVIPERYSRHYYDLCLMAADEHLKRTALGNLALLSDVVLFKKKFYPRSWANYDAAKPGTLKLIPSNHVLNAMRKDYAAMQDMIFGRRPSFEKIVAALSELETEINNPEAIIAAAKIRNLARDSRRQM
jgi:hypothetical protein